MRVSVWDAPVRIFHWALAILAVLSFTTGKLGGSWMGWHVKSGYAVLALLLAAWTALAAAPAFSAEPGTVTIVLAAEPFTLDPGYNSTLLPGQVMRKNIVESLTDISPTDSSISPRLADWRLRKNFRHLKD